MSLKETDNRHLKKLAHELRPVVMVGQAGVSAAVLAEADQALAHHELVKMKISAGDRLLRDEMIGLLVQGTGAELVQRIGNMAILYRHNPKKKNPLRFPAS